MLILICVFFVETFLSKELEDRIQFPQGFLVFTSPALRSDGVITGRAAGGIMLLIRSSLFDCPKCEVIFEKPSILATKLVLKGGYSFCFVGVYRSNNTGSPVFSENFFEEVEDACNTATILNLPTMVAGDFNAKIGDACGLYRNIEEFRDLIPESSEGEEVNEAGAEMLSTFAALDYHRLPFAEQGVEKFTFVVFPTALDPRCGGSVIDYVFFSFELLDLVSSPEQRLEPESRHILLGWLLKV